MNGNTSDSNYRYKLPTFNITVGGKGNGVYTIFNNIELVSKKIGHPTEVIMKYIASITGSNYIPDRSTITGNHKVETLTDIILEYIKYFVICPHCSIPETVPSVVGSKKNSELKLTCLACKNDSIVRNVNKHIDKGIDIIIKYLKSEKTWIISKGTMVDTVSNTNSSNELNPFDSI